MTQYLTARELSSELEKRVRELAPQWVSHIPDLNVRLTGVIADEPDQVLVNLSYEEFLREFEGQFAEWEDGKVVLMSPVSIKHQLLLQFLLRLIAEFTESHMLGLALMAPFQMRLAKIRRGREPDLIFIKSANFARLKKNYLDGPADIAVEIISPESMVRDRNIKFAEYAEAHVPEYWLIDPENEIADFYQLSETGRYQSIPLDAQGFYHSPSLPGLAINPTWFWQVPLPTVRPILRNLGID